MYISQFIAAELLSSVVLDLFPSTQLIENHASEVEYVCDFIFSQPLDQQARYVLEESMRSLIKSEAPLLFCEMMRENAASYLNHVHQPFRADAAHRHECNIVQLIQIDSYKNLVNPRLSSNTLLPSNVSLLGVPKVFTIESKQITIEGESVDVTRIIGTVQPSLQELKRHIKARDLLTKKNHLILGQHMKLFALNDEKELYWLPKGVAWRSFWQRWWLSAVESLGFQQVLTPGVAENGDLIEFKARAHTQIHTIIASQQTNRPFGIAEWFDIPTLTPDSFDSGLFHPKVKTQDILHLLVPPKIVDRELISHLQLFNKFAKILTFEYRWFLVGGRDPHSKLPKAQWNRCIESLEKALIECGFDYVEDMAGAEKRGPKIEVRYRDPLGRYRTGASIGFVKLAPFAQDQSLAMIEGTLFNSVELLLGLLLEQFGGEVPFWMAPEQIRVVAMNPQQMEYAEHVLQRIKDLGCRVTLDSTQEKLGHRVHAAEQEKVPYMVIIGDQEEKQEKITLRICSKGEVKRLIQLDHFLEELRLRTESEYKTHREFLRPCSNN